MILIVFDVEMSGSDGLEMEICDFAGFDVEIVILVHFDMEM